LLFGLFESLSETAGSFGTHPSTVPKFVAKSTSYKRRGTRSGAWNYFQSVLPFTLSGRAHSVSATPSILGAPSESRSVTETTRPSCAQHLKGKKANMHLDEMLSSDSFSGSAGLIANGSVSSSEEPCPRRNAKMGLLRSFRDSMKASFKHISREPVSFSKMGSRVRDLAKTASSKAKAFSQRMSARARGLA